VKFWLLALRNTVREAIADARLTLGQTSPWLVLPG
jgi:hypothetical protein